MVEQPHRKLWWLFKCIRHLQKQLVNLKRLFKGSVSQDRHNSREAFHRLWDLEEASLLSSLLKLFQGCILDIPNSKIYKKNLRISLQKVLSMEKI